MVLYTRSLEWNIRNKELHKDYNRVKQVLNAKLTSKYYVCMSVAAAPPPIQHILLDFFFMWGM